MLSPVAKWNPTASGRAYIVFYIYCFTFTPPHYCFYEYNEGDRIKMAAISDGEVAEILFSVGTIFRGIYNCKIMSNLSKNGIN